MEQNPSPVTQPIQSVPSTPASTNPAPVSPTPTAANMNYPPHKPTSKFLIWGFLIVLIIVGSYLAYTYLTEEPAPTKVQATISVTPQPFNLTLTSPQDKATMINGELLIAGKTLPKTVVIVYTDSDETSLESDETGNFETSVVVGEEGGLVRVTAYSESGEEISKTINASANGTVDVLGKEDKRAAPGLNNEEKQNNGAKDKVMELKTNQREKMEQQELAKENKQERIQEFLKKPPEDKRPDKVGPKDLKRLLSEVSTESAKLDPKLRIQKIAVLEASAGAELKRQAVSGVITSVAEGVLIISHQTQRDRTYAVYYNASTVIASKNTESSGSASFAVGMRIAAVGDPIDDGILAKRIHVIPGKATGVFKKQPVASEEPNDILTPSPEASGTPTITVTPAVTESIPPTPTVELTPTPSI